MAPSEESRHREEDRRTACVGLRRREGLKLLEVSLVYSHCEKDERFTVRLVKTHQDRIANYFNKSPADVEHITPYSSTQSPPRWINRPDVLQSTLRLLVHVSWKENETAVIISSLRADGNFRRPQKSSGASQWNRAAAFCWTTEAAETWFKTETTTKKKQLICWNPSLWKPQDPKMI